MKLQDVLTNKIVIDQTLEITGLQNDSRLVKAGDLFFAYPGSHSDGRNHIHDALEKGASAVVYEASALPEGIVLTENCYPLANLLEHLPQIVSSFYHAPGQNIAITGVTGTNGKTTIAYQLAQAYELLHLSAVYIGTIGQGKPNALESTNNTTPDTLYLQKLLHQYIEQGCEQVCMEVSSHALDQGRVKGLRFKKAIFTNVTLDHLDYHETMENYAKAKAKLFATDGLECAIINNDDQYSSLMHQSLKENCRLLTYGFKEGSDVRAIKSHVSLEGSVIDIITPQGSQQLTIKSIGFFNIYNALAIFASLLADGYDKELIASVISQLNSAPGRMELISTDPVTIVDYAHTPDALENVLTTLSVLKKGKLVLVFGCGGNRDRSKRPIMGAIAEKHADIVIITSDNPRTEKIETIISDIKRGVTQNKKIFVESNRTQAIIMAIQLATPDDIIVVAGKGHEHYQEIGRVKYPFSDANVIREKMINI